MKNIFAKKYEGQALAVIMIVLVVAVVIGMAMLSRTLKDRERVTEEKTSAEALEFSDSILDVVKGTPVEKIEEVCANPDFGGGLEEGCEVKGVSAVENFLTEAGVSTSFLDSFGQCTGNGSDVEMSISLAGSDDDYEIRPDTVRAFVLRQQTPDPAACTLDLEFEPRGSENAGVAVSRVYASGYDANGVPSDYKPYDYDDTVEYCLFRSGDTCPDGTEFSDSWVPLQSGDTLSVPLTSSDGHALDEIRVRAVNSAVGVRSSLSSAQCVEDLEMVKIVVAANCTGSYRAKELQIPQQEWAFPVFDYVLFNGNGVLSPD
jgi:hypothetical protein